MQTKVGNGLPEEKLLSLLRSGEESAYREIYNRHYAVLCHYAQTFLSDGFLAEAVVNDTIYHLWEIRENLLITSSLRQYLMSAVRNRCLNYLKANRRENASLEEAVRAFLGEEVVLGKMLSEEQEKALMEAIEELPEECRTVFKMSRFESLSYAEISSLLGISVNTVKYHIVRALKTIREKIVL